MKLSGNSIKINKNCLWTNEDWNLTVDWWKFKCLGIKLKEKENQAKSYSYLILKKNRPVSIPIRNKNGKNYILVQFNISIGNQELLNTKHFKKYQILKKNLKL